MSARLRARTLWRDWRGSTLRRGRAWFEGKRFAYLLLLGLEEQMRKCRLHRGMSLTASEPSKVNAGSWHKPDFGEVTTWELFAKRNHERSMALTTEREKEKRSALLGAPKGFLNATEFVQPDPDDTKHYLLFACVSQSNPWMRSLEDVLSSVEMYMTVTGAITCPVLTHMGITRVAGCRNPTKGLAVRFHALTAWALTRGTLRDRAVRPKYMLTAPLSYMGELLGKVGGKDLKFSKTGQGWGQTIKAVLPDETTLTCSTLVLPWLTKLAFTHDKPMIIEYAELAKLADPL